MKRRIMILYPPSIPWMALCLDGIRKYANAEGGWHLFCTPPAFLGTGETSIGVAAIRDWKCDGIILATNDASDLRKLHELNIPAINLAGGISEQHGIPRVMVNHHLAGRMAADHLMGIGLKNLAFFGWEQMRYSQQRQLGFEERAAESGVFCNSYLIAPHEPLDSSWALRIAACSKWLLSLPRPSGIFTAQDYRAQFLMEACQESGLRIPEDMAILGMDNDTTICEHSVPTLSSIARNSEQVGWEAASLLDRLMKGGSCPMSDVLLPPDKIVSRQSTNMFYCKDPLILEAIDYMKLHLKSNFNILSIADHLKVSKRTLEIKFASNLKETPHEFLIKLRIQQALLQLASIDKKQTVEQISVDCGFITPATFYSAFKRIIGQSPASYRKTILSKKSHPRGFQTNPD